MKNVFKTAALLLLFGLNACGKDDITIEKNESTTWEIDKSIVDDDIRTRIGYDPRTQQAFFKKEEGDLPVLSLGDAPVGDTNTFSTTVHLTHKANKAIQVSLVYDATLYDKLKDKYAGYELGDANLVTLIQNQITITEGERSGSFAFTVSNNKNFNKEVILPFALKISDPEVKILTGSEIFVLRVYPETISLEVEIPDAQKFLGIGRVITKNVLTGEATINGNVDLPIAPSAKIPSDLFVKWVLNDDGSIPFIIPTNTYILEEKKSIKDVERVPFTVKFQNLSIIEGPAYLPLKVVLYDTQGNEYPTDTTVFIAITTKTTYPNDWVEGSNNSVTPSGTKITLAGGQFSSDILDRGQNFDNAIDGNEATFAQIKTNRNSTALDFVFTEQKNLKTIRVKLDDSTPITMLRVRVLNGVDLQGVNIGVATFTSTDGWYVITLKQKLPVNGIRLVDFLNNGKKGIFKIKEVEFYEE